jgi:hypothetical protein
MASPGAAFSAALAAEDFPLVRACAPLVPAQPRAESAAAAADLLWWRFAVQVEGQEGMGMAPDKYREVFDLAQRGTRAFRDRRFDEVRLELIPSSTLLPVRGGVSVSRAGVCSRVA